MMEGCDLAMEWKFACLSSLPHPRQVLSPRLNNIAFVGLNASFQHTLTTALQSRWLAAALTQEVKLPSKEDQEADITKQQVALIPKSG